MKPDTKYFNDGTPAFYERVISGAASKAGIGVTKSSHTVPAGNQPCQIIHIEGGLENYPLCRVHISVTVVEGKISVFAGFAYESSDRDANSTSIKFSNVQDRKLAKMLEISVQQFNDFMGGLQDG